MESIDLARAFKAPFQDKEWVTKTLLGFLWTLLVVTAPAVYGAQVEYISRVSHGDETLPDWSDFGSKWMRGFLVMVAGFIYFLPVVVISIVFLVPVMIASIGGSSDALAGLAAGGTCLFTLLAVIYGLAVSIIFNAAITNYAMKNDFGAFFEFGAIMSRVRDGSGYFTAWLWALVAGAASSIVVSVLSSTGIGGILVPAVSYLLAMITGHLFGQWAARSYGVVAAAPAAPMGYMPPPPAPPAPPYAPAPTTAPVPQAPQPPMTPPEPPAPSSGFSAPPAAPRTPTPPAAPGSPQEPPS